MHALFEKIENRLIHEKGRVTFDEAIALTDVPHTDVPDLLALAHRVRVHYCGESVELESLISAKTGGCMEDCAFCSQSVHYQTDIKRHPLFRADKILEGAKASEAAGATQYCIVVAVRGPDEPLMRIVLQAIDLIHAQTKLKVDCSLGLLSREQAVRLKNAGVHHYNHNLEGARSFFPQIVKTHSWDDRVDTCRIVKEVGMGLCSGGIFGMGETWRQRIELAFELAEIGVDEVPLNFLNPRPGTPLGDVEPLPAMDALKISAIYRLILPEVMLRWGGGRELVLREMQAMGLSGGINGLIIGNYLTTTGQPPVDDIKMLADLGMPIRA